MGGFSFGQKMGSLLHRLPSGAEIRVSYSPDNQVRFDVYFEGLYFPYTNGQGEAYWPYEDQKAMIEKIKLEAEKLEAEGHAPWM